METDVKTMKYKCKRCGTELDVKMGKNFLPEAFECPVCHLKLVYGEPDKYGFREMKVIE